MLIVEIKDNSLILLVGESKMTKFVLKKAKIFEISENWNEYISNEGNFATLSSAFMEYKNKQTKVHLCLSTSAVIYRDMVIPKTNRKFTSALIRNELINVLSLTPEYLIDYAIIGESVESGNSSNKILASAILSSSLNEYMEFFKQIGLRISQIDVGLNALVKYLEMTDMIPAEKNTLVVDVDLQSIRQYLFEKGHYSFYRNTKLSSKMNQSVLPSIENYTENIEKMMQFAVLQGQKTEIDELILFGNKKVLPKLNKYLNARIAIGSRLLFKPKQVECDGLPFDSIYAYALGVIFALKKKRKKDIDFLNEYNEYYKIKKHELDLNQYFKLTLTVFIVAILLLFGFKMFDSYKISSETKAINAYLTQPEVVATMNEIVSMRKSISEIKAISVEIISIKTVLDSIPRFTQERVSQIYSVKPADITITSMEFKDGSIKIAIQTLNSTQIHRYVLALTNLKVFEDVKFIAYRLVPGGLFTSEITIILKGGQ